MKNKVVLITGGANGIGKATALKLSENNKVVIIDNNSNACNLLSKEDPSIKVFNEDITNFNSIEKIINRIYLEYDNIDILINNAGIQTVGNIMNLNLDEWESVIKVNLTATFFITQIVANKMKENSTILNVISTHYNKPRIDKLHYDISKSGVSILTKGFAMELAEKRVTVNALAIGATYTLMNKDFVDDIDIVNTALEKIPLKYICNPEDIAEYIHNLIKDFSMNTTGSIFVVDGGRSLI